MTAVLNNERSRVCPFVPIINEMECMNMSDAIKRTVQGPVAVITLDAPPVNALDSSAYFDLYPDAQQKVNGGNGVGQRGVKQAAK